MNANLRKKSSLTKAQRTFLIYTYFYLDILGAYEREELVGFVIFEPASGDISSLAVAKDYRRKGIGKSLLKSAVSHFQSDVLKFTNVDCDCVAKLPVHIAELLVDISIRG